MKKASQITVNQKATSKVSLVVLFVLLLSSVGMSAQNVETAKSTTDNIEITVAADDNATVAHASEANSSLNMVSWFMGSKQTPKSTISNEGATSSKKQMINAGVAPNRLLIKAFLKKASNYQSTIA